MNSDLQLETNDYPYLSAPFPEGPSFKGLRASPASMTCSFGWKFLLTHEVGSWALGLRGQIRLN